MIPHHRLHDFVANEQNDRFEKVGEAAGNQSGLAEGADEQGDQQGAGHPHHHDVAGDGKVQAENRFELREVYSAVEDVVGIDEGHLQMPGIHDVPDDIYFSIRGVSRARIACH